MLPRIPILRNQNVQFIEPLNYPPLIIDWDPLPKPQYARAQSCASKSATPSFWMINPLNFGPRKLKFKSPPLRLRPRLWGRIWLEYIASSLWSLNPCRSVLSRPIRAWEIEKWGKENMRASITLDIFPGKCMPFLTSVQASDVMRSKNVQCCTNERWSMWWNHSGLSGGTFRIPSLAEFRPVSDALWISRVPFTQGFFSAAE